MFKLNFKLLCLKKNMPKTLMYSCICDWQFERLASSLLNYYCS